MVGAPAVWIALYGVAAVAVAVATLLVADAMREPGVPAPERMGRFAVLAGLLWPVTVVGAVQIGLLVALQHRHRSAVTRGRSREGVVHGLVGAGARDGAVGGLTR